MSQRTEQTAAGGFTQIANKISATGKLRIRSGKWKVFGWFTAVNAAIVLSLSIISGGALIGVFPVVLLMGSTFPFIMLLCSRWLAKRSHQIYIIRPEQFRSDSERSLYTLVESLSRKAGIQRTPQVGIYNSDDANAFATGATRNSSLVAFSSGLFNKMDDQAIAAVAAHEIGHIANGDMVTLALVQSVVNTIVLLCTLPLQLLQWFVAWFSEQGSYLFYLLVALLRFMLTAILMFLGNLLIKAFSRKREFQADKLAAYLLDRHSMIHALECLKQDPPIFNRKQQSYAAFKINSPTAWLDLFSTHPSIEKRIEALKRLGQ